MLRPQPGIFPSWRFCAFTQASGANAAVLQLDRRHPLRPYPPSRTRAPRRHRRHLTRRNPGHPALLARFPDLQRSCTLCETLFVSKITGTTAQHAANRAERTTGSIVSATTSTPSASPMLGRGFLPAKTRGQGASRRRDQLPTVAGRFPRPIRKSSARRSASTASCTPSSAVRPRRLFTAPFVGWGMNFWVPASDGGHLQSRR